MQIQRNINSISRSWVFTYIRIKRLLALSFYLVLRILWLPVRLFSRRDIPDKIEKIVIVSRLKIGESVVTSPAISLLRKRYPRARIDVICQSIVKPLLECFPEVDNIITDADRDTLRTLRAVEYDVALNFGFRFRDVLKTRLLGAKCAIGYDYLGRGFLLDRGLKMPMQAGKPMWDFEDDEQVIHQATLWVRMISVLGIDPAEAGEPDLRITSIDVWRKVDDILEDAGIDPSKSFVAFHPFQSNACYEWKMDRWAQLAEECSWRLGMPLVLLGSKSDAARAQKIEDEAEADVVNLCGKTSLLETTALLYRASILVSVDNGFAHVADAVGTPVITLFGPGSPWIWRPFRAANTVIHKTNIHCYGCRQTKCLQPTHVCMDAIEVADVLVAIERYLQNDVVALAGDRRKGRKTTSLYSSS